MYILLDLSMNDLKNKFIEFTLNHEILRFGNFTLKSGRKSPYFFNSGLCSTGILLNKLADCYAKYIVDNISDFDYIFGPAYKGITLSASISMILESKYGINKSFLFNRKESKDHGELGLFVGGKPYGKALVVDDVISSGSSIINSLQLINESKSTSQNVLVAFDRMEVGSKDRASIELSEKFDISIHSIITLDDIFNYVSANKKYEMHMEDMKNYMDLYKR